LKAVSINGRPAPPGSRQIPILNNVELAPYQMDPYLFISVHEWSQSLPAMGNI
jgi:hypothetical protein